MQFDDWNARLRETCGHYYGVPVKSRRSVNGFVRLASFHGLDMADIACDLDRIDRTARGIRLDESEYVFLILQLSGRSLIEHEGRQQVVRPGEFYLLDSTREARIRYDGEECHFFSVHMPRGAFLRECDGRLRLGRTLERDHAMNAPMRAFFDDGRRAGGGSPRADPTFLYDLARIAFSGEEDGVDGARMRSGDNRYCLAVGAIEDNITRPDLSLGWLARRIGISERQLQRDFLEHGASFVQVVREKRLALAATFLTAAGRPRMSITDVALRTGFNDISNFNRSFKGRYGCSPSDFARSCA